MSANLLMTSGSVTFSGYAGFADGAAPITPSVADEHNPLARIEARLTDEVLRLARILGDFADRTKAIGDEIPDTAHFCKSVTTLYRLCALQLGNALLKGLDKPILFDDGCLYLKKLGLEVEDLFRQFDFEGRKFFAVALVDECPGNVPEEGDTGDCCVEGRDDVHGCVPSVVEKGGVGTPDSTHGGEHSRPIAEGEP